MQLEGVFSGIWFYDSCGFTKPSYENCDVDHLLEGLVHGRLPWTDLDQTFCAHLVQRCKSCINVHIPVHFHLQSPQDYDQSLEQ